MSKTMAKTVKKGQDSFVLPEKNKPSLARKIVAKIGGYFSWILAKRKRVVISVLVLVMVMGAILILVNINNNKISYTTTKATKGTLVTTISTSGSISVGSNNTITTSATGVVKEVYVKVGDKVSKGQKIAYLELDQDSLQRQASAYSSYLSAKNQLASANTKYYTLQAAEFKANQAFINDAVARGLETDDPTYIQENATWLAAEADYINQASSVKQAEIAVSSAWYTYQQISSTIVAPTSGIINSLNIAPGLVIESSGSSSTSTTTFQQIGTITDELGHFQATVSLSEVDVTKVKAGQKVSLTLDAFSDLTFAGEVLLVNTTGEVSSGVTTYPAVIEFDSDLTNIYQNMAVTANIIVDTVADTILVPSSAITASDSGSVVQILKDGKPVIVTVEVAGTNGTQSAISSGVSEGDLVITGSSTRTKKSSSSSSSTTSVFSSITRTGGGPGGEVRGVMTGPR
jgi:RND family efflux transporter MFP subunit